MASSHRSIRSRIRAGVSRKQASLRQRAVALAVTTVLAFSANPAIATTLGEEARSAVDTIVDTTHDRDHSILHRWMTPRKSDKAKSQSPHPESAGTPDQRASQVQHIQLCPRNLLLYPEETFTLVPLPLDRSRQTVHGSAMTWGSSNPAIASVTSWGEVDAVAQGHATVTLQIGAARATVSVDVQAGHRPRQADSAWDSVHGHDCDSPESAELDRPFSAPEHTAAATLDAGAAAPIPSLHLGVSEAAYAITNHTQAVEVDHGSGFTSASAPIPAAWRRDLTSAPALPATLKRSTPPRLRTISAKVNLTQPDPLRNTGATALFQGGNPDVFFTQATTIDNAVGSPRYAPVEKSKNTTGTKNHLGSSNYNFSVAVLGLKGRGGTDLSLSLSYNGELWGKDTTGTPTRMIFNYGAMSMAPGWSMGYGRVIANFDNTATGNESSIGAANSPGDYLLIAPDGTRIPFAQQFDTVNNVWNHTSADGQFTFFNPRSLRMIYNDGTQVTYGSMNNKILPMSFKSRNGDLITIAYRQNGPSFPNRFAIQQIIDSLGRIVQFWYYGDSGYPTDGTDATPLAALAAITTPDLGGGTRTLITIEYQNVNLNYNFDPTFEIDGATANTPIIAVRRIYYPATGTGYLFVNNNSQASLNFSSYGMCRYISVRNNMTGASGAITDGSEISYTQYDFTDVSTQSGALNKPPTYANRSEWWQGKVDGLSPAVYQYTRTINGGLDIDTVVEPLTGLNVVTTSAGGQVIEVDYKNGTTVLRSINYGYEVCPDLSCPTSCDPTNLVFVATTDDAGNTSSVSYTYCGSYNRVSEMDETDFSGSIVRKTTYQYLDDSAHINANMLHLVKQVNVLDGPSGTVMAKTIFTYDDYTAKGGMEFYGLTPSQYPPNHAAGFDQNHTTRGNVTGVQTFSSISPAVSVTRNSKIDIFGNVTVADVSCCNVKTFTFSGTTLYSQPDSVTSGTPNVVPFLTTAYTYDSNTGLLMNSTDPGNQQTSYSYDTAWRPKTVSTASGATTTTLVGKDANQNDQLFATSQVAYTDSDGTPKNVTTKNWFDGTGRTILKGTGTGSSPTSFDAVAMGYDSIGRPLNQSNPYTVDSSGTGTASFLTRNTYDALSRVILVTLPDNQTIQTSHSGATVTVTDQVGRKRQSKSDAQGRVVSVAEQDPATGNLFDSSGNPLFGTSYTYDALNNLTQVNQGGQTRTFRYDAAGREIFERIPEETATINDGTGTLWTCAYTYTDFDAVHTRTDARNVLTTYGYDPLNRIHMITYDISQAPGVAATSNVTINYNNLSSSLPSNGQISDLADGAGTETYSYDNFARLSGKTRMIDSNSYQTQYQYNPIGQITLTIYPSGKRIRSNYDTRGRLLGEDNVNISGTMLTSYMSSIQYDTAGHTTGLSLGNGLSETYSYSSDRMQLTGQTVKQGAATRMNLIYNYQAAALASGANTVAGNSGELMAISSGSTINGQARDQAFTYDDMGRLVTATGWGAWQRRYDLDRWGNRTAMWDAVSGGNQLQNVALQQSGGAPTNRITSVTTTATFTYAYDVAGNVTGDGVHNYQYDAEGRIAKVDQSTTNEADYLYDLNNWRVKKVTGVGSSNPTTTYYVWDGGRVIAEYSTAPPTSTAAVKYYHPDRLSTRMITDSSGTVIGAEDVLPFGEDAGTSTGLTEKHRFTNYERDGETGTDYAVNRQYASTLGRMMQRDRVAGSMTNPQNLNRYSYALNDPIDVTDPTGNTLWYGLYVYLGTYADGNLVGSDYLGFIPLYPLDAAGSVLFQWYAQGPLWNNARSGIRGRLDDLLRKILGNQKCIDWFNARSAQVGHAANLTDLFKNTGFNFYLSTDQVSLEGLKGLNTSQFGVGEGFGQTLYGGTGKAQVVINRSAFDNLNNSGIVKEVIHEMFHAAGLHGSDPKGSGILGLQTPNDLNPEVQWGDIQKNCVDNFAY